MTHHKSGVDFLQDLFLIQCHVFALSLLDPFLLQLLTRVHFPCGLDLTSAYLAKASFTEHSVHSKCVLRHRSTENHGDGDVIGGVHTYSAGLDNSQLGQRVGQGYPRVMMVSHSIRHSQLQPFPLKISLEIHTLDKLIKRLFAEVFFNFPASEMVKYESVRNKKTNKHQIDRQRGKGDRREVGAGVEWAGVL